MFYINQIRTPSFLIGLVKTESGFILRSVETGIGRWTLVVAVVSVDAYPFFWLSQTWPGTLRMQEWVLSGCTVLPDSKETKLGSSNQEVSPSAGKNIRVVLVPFCAWRCVPTATFSGMGISEVPVCHLLWQMSSQWASQKLFKDRCLMNSHPTFLFLTFSNLMNYGHIIKSM